jgi:ribosomal protein S10
MQNALRGNEDFPVISKRDLTGELLTPSFVASMNEMASLINQHPAGPEFMQRRRQLEDQSREIREEAREFMKRLAREGRLPHRLEKSYFLLENTKGVNSDGSPVLSPVEFLPLHSIWVPEDSPIPVSLQTAGYDRHSARTFMELERKSFDQIRIGASTFSLKSYPQKAIDGISCYILPIAKETGFDRKKIINDVFRPLGYQKESGAKGSVGFYAYRKIISQTEYLQTIFDLGTYRQTVSAVFDYCNGGFSLRLPLIYWPLEYPHGGFFQIHITTKDIFKMTFENIGTLVKFLEAEYVPRFKKMCRDCV